MTRDEERQQAADNYVGHPQEVGEGLYINTSRKSFKNGAEWADEHPNPELKKQWIKKACNWLKKHGGFTLGFPGAEVKDFCKYMED